MFDLPVLIKRLKKLLTKKDLVFLAILVCLFFITRLINLERFPIFCDEGIYIRWAKVAWHDASWRFISLTDGKQPLHTWGMIPFLKLFPDNALFAGRLFSVLTGFIALVGIFITLYYLFGKKTALVGTLIYTITPYFLFYDRLALIDSGVNAAFIWIFFLSILFVKYNGLDIALIFGLTAGISLLAKSSVKMFIALSALAPIIMIDRNIKKTVIRIINFFVLFVFTCLIAISIYNIQRLSPFFHYVAQKNNTFVMTFSEFIRHPLAVFFTNIRILPLYVLWESGFILGIVALLGLIKLFQTQKRLAIYIGLWILLPFVAIVFFTKVLFPRYVIFFGSLLVILSSFYIGKIKSRRMMLSLLLPVIVFQLWFSYPIIFNPVKTSLPEVDMGQYIDGVTAGWGTDEIVEFARGKSQEKPVILLAEGNFGLIADMLEVFIRKDDKISVRGFWPLNESDLIANQKELGNNYVYAVFPHRTEFPDNWPIKLIKKFTKPNSQSAIYLFELIP